MNVNTAVHAMTSSLALARLHTPRSSIRAGGAAAQTRRCSGSSSRETESSSQMAMLNRIYGLGVGFAFMAAGGALALGRARRKPAEVAELSADEPNADDGGGASKNS